MDDHQLLELAARGALGNTSIPDQPLQMIAKGWNPLTDDGDAFRLATKLGLEIRRGRWPSGARYVSAHQVWNPNDSCYEDDGVAVNPDACAATRRAIVQAAARIAKELNHG